MGGKRALAPPVGYKGSMNRFLAGAAATRKADSQRNQAPGNGLLGPAPQAPQGQGGQGAGPSNPQRNPPAAEHPVAGPSAPLPPGHGQPVPVAPAAAPAPASPAAAPSPAPSQRLDPEAQATMVENAVRAARREAEAALEAALAAARAAAAAAPAPLADAPMNAAQREAATAAVDRPLQIVAGAGTGKTTTVLQRVRYMVLHRGVHPAAVLIISFTVKAAKEAAERLARMGLPGADRIRVGTFHSYCFSVLRSYYRLAGYDRLPTILAEEADLRRVLATAMVRAEVEGQREVVCSWLGLPALETTWQGALDAARAAHPGEVAAGAAAAATWFTGKAVAKLKKKRRAKAKAAPRKRKGAAEAAPPAAAAAAGLSSPKKQARLNFGGAGTSRPAEPAPAAPAAEQAEAEAEAEAEAPEFDAAAVAAAGDLGAMPVELRTAVLAFTYVELYRLYDPGAHGVEAARCAEAAAAKKMSKKAAAGAAAALEGTMGAAMLARPAPKVLRQALDAIERVKRRGASPTELDPRMQRCFAAYQEELRAQTAVDFNDLLLAVRELLVRHAWVGARLRARHPYVIVDEFQDSNAVQMEILQAIAPPAAVPGLTVVGDGDQSIYRFRGAEPHILYHFQTQYEGHADVMAPGGGEYRLRRRLELNYRCTGNILDAAAAALVGNAGRDGAERLVAAKEGPAEAVTVAELADADAEARWITGEITGALAAGTPPQEIAVLFRNFKTKFGRTYEPLRRELEAAGIPYRVVRELSLLSRAAVKDVLAYADLVLNPGNDASFLRVFNTPKRRLGAKVKDLLEVAQEEAAAAGQRRSLMDCARDVAAGGGGPGLELGPSQRAALRGFVALVDGLRAEAAVLRPAEVLDRIIARSGYLDHLAAEAKKKKEKAEAADGAADPEQEEEEGGGKDGGDGSGDESESEDEEEGDDGGVQGPPEGMETPPGSARGPKPATWPYRFLCAEGLKGPLKRLHGEALRWAAEEQPRLGLGGDNGPPAPAPTGPPSLETLALEALATREGRRQVGLLLASAGDGGPGRNPAALEVVASASGAGPAALADFVSFLRLNQTDISAGAPADALSSAEMGVNISTIHAAKGLEWDVVFVPRFNQGFLPSLNAEDAALAEMGESDGEEGGMDAGGGGAAAAMAAEIAAEEGARRREAKLSADEERRLAHVAMTRARAKLYCSYVKFDRAVGGVVDRSDILSEVLERCRGAVEMVVVDK